MRGFLLVVEWGIGLLRKISEVATIIKGVGFSKGSIAFSLFLFNRLHFFGYITDLM